MGRGREKLKAKFAGAFVSFRGFISIILLAFDSISGAEIGFLFAFSFFIAIATFLSGLGVLIASRKAYFAATSLTVVHLLFFSGGLLGLFLDLAILGALWQGWRIQIKESFDVTKSMSRSH